MKLMTRPHQDELLERAREGDDLARRALVDQLYPGVLSLSLKLLRDEDLARETAQETFLRAFAKLDQFSGDSPFKSWVFKIATNYIRDMARRRSRRWEPSTEEPVEETDADSVLQRDEEIARVREALDALPGETRAAMILHLQEGMPIQDIAYSLGITKHAARMKVYRGLQKIRAQVREEQ